MAGELLGRIGVGGLLLVLPLDFRDPRTRAVEDRLRDQ
jgi:hypothetical protein